MRAGVQTESARPDGTHQALAWSLVARRLTLALSLLALAAGAAPAAAQTTTPTDTGDTGGALAPPDPAPPGTAHELLVVGDSLAVGLRPYLGALLPADHITYDVRTGRTTPVGLERLRAQLKLVTPETVIISLGTNDGPDPGTFAGRIRRVLAAVPLPACVVWADINRPARKGAYAALNHVLQTIAASDPRLVIVPWNHEVASGRVTLPDGLHPDAAGFQDRSRLFADAVTRGCGA